MNDVKESMSRNLFGRSRTKSIVNAVCVACGGDATKFSDRLSKQEYLISGLCQKCQDKVFCDPDNE